MLVLEMASSPQKAKKPSFSFKFQKLANDGKRIKKGKSIGGKSSESIKEDIYKFSENRNLMLVSST
jgi:hypothetical protein